MGMGKATLGYQFGIFNNYAIRGESEMLSTILMSLALVANPVPYPAGLRRPVPPPAAGMLRQVEAVEIVAVVEEKAEAVEESVDSDAIVPIGEPEDHPHGPKAPRPDLFDGGRLKRLPGPTWWGCPTCGSSSCTMYLGEHLRSKRGAHKVTNEKLNEVGYKYWYTYHDNLHNVDYKAPAKKAASGCTNCQGGQCQNRASGRPRIFGWLPRGRW